MKRYLMIRKCYLKILLSALLWSLTACSNEAEEKQPGVQLASEKYISTIALPDIFRQPVRLTVASVVNPRFKKLSDPQINKILLRSQIGRANV